MEFSLKKIITVTLLVSFFAIMSLSFIMMTGESEATMASDCPFSTMSGSLCPQGTAIDVHHIAAYYSFLNVPVGIGTGAIIISFLLALFATLVICICKLLFDPPIFKSEFFEPPSFNSYTRKIIRWLSLLENSPSLT